MSGGVTHTDETSGQGECRAATTSVSFKYRFGGAISFCFFSSYKKGPKVHMWGGGDRNEARVFPGVPEGVGGGRKQC